MMLWTSKQLVHCPLKILKQERRRIEDPSLNCKTQTANPEKSARLNGKKLRLVLSRVIKIQAIWKKLKGGQYLCCSTLNQIPEPYWQLQLRNMVHTLSTSTSYQIMRYCIRTCLYVPGTSICIQHVVPEKFKRTGGVKCRKSYFSMIE